MADKINKMFSKIYREYDFMNHLFSMNIDKSWRKEAAKDAMLAKDVYIVLDVASGTGDLAIAINKMAKAYGKKVQIYAHDFNKNMLKVAKSKFRDAGMGNVKVELGSAFNIKHKKDSIDVITSGFALRSFVNSGKGKRNLRLFLAEAYRTLKPGGRVILLDMAMPDKEHERIFFDFYSGIMIFMGSFVSKDTYQWLVRTIKTFDKKELLAAMKLSGFKNVKIRNLTSGIAFIATGNK